MKQVSSLGLAAVFAVAASPAFAASKNPFSPDFWSLANTDMIVLLAFVIFVGILIKFKVPEMLMSLLDKRAAGIRSDLDEAKALREEARLLLASYEQKQGEVQEQAERIVATAKDEATRAAKLAEDEIEVSVSRRLTAAQEQIESAKAAAIRDVRNEAVNVAIAAARDVIAAQTTADAADKMIDASITEVGAKLH